MLSKHVLPEPVLSSLVLALNNLYIYTGCLRKRTWAEADVTDFRQVISNTLASLKVAFEGFDKTNFHYIKFHLSWHFLDFIKEHGAPELANTGTYENFHIE
jgi:hypothetical protein